MNTQSSALLLISKTHKCVCVNVSDFLDIFLRDSAFPEFTPIADRDTLKTGEHKIYVSYIVENNHIRISDLDNPNTKEVKDWSDEISYKKYVEDNANLIILL